MSFILTVTYAECHILAPNADCHYVERRHAECRYAECRGAPLSAYSVGRLLGLYS